MPAFESIVRVTVSAMLLRLVACNQSDFGQLGGEFPEDGETGDDRRPGDDAREDDEHVACENDDACNTGEACVEGICQMARCKDGPYLSAPPIRSGLAFFLDRELLIADANPFEGSYYVDGYAPRPGGFDYPGSWNTSDTRITDLAGGDFYGRDIESFVIAAAGRTDVVVVGDDESQQSIVVGFEPYAIAAGDFDRDQRDEIVAASRFGNVAICEVEAGTCETYVVQNGEVLDVTAGDVDADGHAEPVLLLAQDDARFIYTMEPSPSADEGDAEDVSTPGADRLERLEAGDLDGDGQDELVGYASGNFGSEAQLVVYGTSDGQALEQTRRDTASGGRDLALADLDGDNIDEVLVLHDGATVELLRAASGSFQLVPELQQPLDVSVAPDRLSASDFDGDSPRVRLMHDEPTLVPGPVVPTIVVHFPPFDAQHSADESSFFVGETMSVSEYTSDSISLGARAEIGFGSPKFLQDLASVSVSATLSNEVRRAVGQGQERSIGQRLSGSPAPELLGFDYGMVMLSCACFHAYYYEVDDPSDRLNSELDAEQFVVVLPVSGTTTGWSTQRYNAMAEAVGGLPKIEIPYRIGDVESYPSGPARANGEPIVSEDLVFPEVPSFLVSDAADVGWALSVGETSINEVSTTTRVELSGKLNVGPFSFGGAGSLSEGHSYSISVGESALFGGSVPPIPNDPATPEDEYEAFAFSFAPYVYREHYTDADGNPAGYYVMSYAVADP